MALTQRPRSIVTRASCISIPCGSSIMGIQDDLNLYKDCLQLNLHNIQIYKKHNDIKYIKNNIYNYFNQIPSITLKIFTIKKII